MNAMNGMHLMHGANAAAVERYWVLGGEYSDTRFAELREGTSRIYGPFSSYDVARARWRMAAEETRGNACIRFTIARES